MEGAELWRGLDRAARHALPAASILMMVVVLGIPGLLPFQPACRAGFVVASVFFWTLYRPAAVPAPIVALLGVVLDLLGASPLGMWAALLLIEQAGIAAVRRSLVAQGFPLVWLAFAGVALAVAAAEYATRSLLDLVILPPGPIVTQAIIAILLYPLLAVILIRAHRGPAAPEQA